MYTEISVIIEGALDETKTVQGDGEVEVVQLADEVREAAKLQGFNEWAIYVLTHDHPEVDECACVQYLTDHKPRFSS